MVDGVPVFIGLLTVTNEHGEIVVMSLVPTKAHSQFTPALDALRTRLEGFGHQQPQLAYTDDIGNDEAMLKKHFPSLSIGVRAPPSASPYAHLPIYKSPFPVAILNSGPDVDHVMRIITESIPEGGTVVVGFDIEWNLKLAEAPNGSVTSSRRGERTAVAQISTHEVVYIIQVSLGPDWGTRSCELTRSALVRQLARIYRQGRRLPSSLLEFLTNPSIIKTGVGVVRDLNLLVQDFRTDTPRGVVAEARGGVDLRALARQAGVEGTKLDQLVALVLSKCLDKPKGVRMSEAWEDDLLSPEHLAYAAADATAGLELHQKLSHLIRTQPLPPMSPVPPTLLQPGFPVALVASGKQVALGTVLALPSSSPSTRPNTIADINITKTRVALTITHVLVPSSLALEHRPRKSSSGPPQDAPSLGSFGAAPFQLVVKTANLRTASTLPPLEPAPVVDASRVELEESEGAATGAPEGFVELAPAELIAWDQFEVEDGGASARVFALAVEADLSLSDDVDASREEEDDVRVAQQDQDSLAQAYEFLQQFIDNPLPPPSPSSSSLLTRILLDVWHLMDRIYVPRRHGCRASFMRAYADILFVLNAEDKQLLSARFEREGSSWEIEFPRKRKYCLARCRRTIPPPHQLVPLLITLFKEYGPMKDAKSKRPLFNKDAWKAAARVLEMVKGGYVSDPPGIELYTVLKPCGGKTGKLNDGVQVYRCFRGTNMTEGGVHQNLRRRFPQSGVSIRHAAARLTDYRYIHNVSVSRLGVCSAPAAQLTPHNNRSASGIEQDDLTASTTTSDC